MPLQGGRTPFVGRGRELGVLLRHLEAAGQGQGRLVLLGGEPGIGKTRLALELAARARAQGWQVMLGHAYETEGMPPYLPFTEALQNHVRTCPLDDLQTQLGRGGQDVARLVPGLRERLPDEPKRTPLSPEHERYQLFESVCDLLLAISQFGEVRGLLLVLEDLQWADRSTLLLVRHLARRLAQTPMLVLGTHRPVDQDRDNPLRDLLADLRREDCGEQLLLGPLTLNEAAALITAINGSAVAPDVAEAVYRATEGTPFFLYELVRHLQAEGRDLSDPRAAAAEWGVPEGVRQVVGHRLARLSPEANRALQGAAILGDGFTFDVLRAVVDWEPEPLLDALDEAERAAMLREEAGAYHFSHALIRKTVSEGLSGPRQQRLHLRAAEALERIYQRDLRPYIAALAYHYRRAGPEGSSDIALAYARQAAEAAAAAFAWEEQAAHLQIALELLGPGGDAQRCELLLDLGEAQERSGDLQTATETFRRAAGIARSLPAPEAFGRAALGMVYVWGGRTTDPSAGAVRWLEEALSLLGDNDSVLRARLLARFVLVLLDRQDNDRAAALAVVAVSVARRISDPVALCYALRSRHVLLMRPEQLEERLAVANEIVRLAEEADDRGLALQGRHWRFVDLLELGDRSAFDVELPAYIRLAEEFRQPFLLWQARLEQGMHALLEGRFADAGRHSAEAFAIGRRSQGATQAATFAVQIRHLRWQRGSLEDMEAIVKEAPDPLGPRPLSLVGCAYHELGLEKEARRVYEHALSARFGIAWILGRGSPGPEAWSLPALADFCQLCASLGEVRRAGELYGRLLPYARHCFLRGYAETCTGAFAHYLGLLAVTIGRFQEAEQHFEQAIEINGRLGGRPLVANSQREIAAMFLERRRPGDRERAHELLGQALATYSELGMEHWAGKAQALLARAGLAPSRPTAPYPDRLTQRELEVLRLIAAGRSTREVAEELVISAGTAERHIGNIYKKIGARSRSDATAYAFRTRLTVPSTP